MTRGRARFSTTRLSAALALLVLLGVGLGPTPRVDAASPVTFTSITPSKIAAPADYASDVRGYYWDFSNGTTHNVEDTRGGFPDGAVANGWFTGTAAKSDAKLWLQRMTLPETVTIPIEGAAAPIDTSVYRYLSIRMCSSVATSAYAYWFATATVYGWAGAEPISAGCGLYTIDLNADHHGGSIAWGAGPVQTIAVRTGTATGISVAVDYAILAPDPPSSSPPVTIKWTPVAGTFDLFFDSDDSAGRRTLIASGVDASTGTYTWAAGPLAPGKYYAVARDGADQSVSMPFEVNSPPRTPITAPSFLTGPDYATTFGADPWDMSALTDILRADGVKDVSISSGMYCATNGTNDPSLYLRVPEPIDPDRFYYATYRMQIFGVRDLNAGSVARYLYTNGTRIGVTQDIVDYEGWQTVSIDLREALLESGTGPWRDGKKTWFRLDPHEFPSQRRFCIDDVRLTGDDLAAGRYVIRTAQADEDGGPVTPSYFFTATEGATSGGTRITCLPPADAGSCTWDTSKVATGRYYIYVVARDDLNTTVVASDTAVQVTRSLDEEPPASAITGPAGGGSYGALTYLALCDASTNEVCGTATDTGSGVARVDVSIKRDSDGKYWDGSGFRSLAELFHEASSDASWEYAFPRPPDGGYTIRSRATDQFGNVETPGVGTTFTIDTVQPSAKLVLPESTRERTVAVELSGTDSVGVSGYFLSERSARPLADAPSWRSRRPETFTLSAADGRKTVYGWTRDAAGNVSRTAFDVVKLDSTAPSVTLKTAPFARSPKLFLQLSASDASPIAGYFLALTRAKPRPDAPGWMAKKPASFVLPESKDGRRAVFAFAKDTAGNISRPAVARLMLDTHVPMVRIGAPRAGETLASLTRIRGVMNDAQPSSGLGRAEFAIRAQDCSWWNPNNSQFVPGKCNAAVWYPIPPSRRWSTTVGRLAISGAYVLLVRFADRAGNTETVLTPFKIR